MKIRSDGIYGVRAYTRENTEYFRVFVWPKLLIDWSIREPNETYEGNDRENLLMFTTAMTTPTPMAVPHTFTHTTKAPLRRNAMWRADGEYRESRLAAYRNLDRVDECISRDNSEKWVMWTRLFSDSGKQSLIYSIAIVFVNFSSGTECPHSDLSWKAQQ